MSDRRFRENRNRKEWNMPATLATFRRHRLVAILPLALLAMVVKLLIGGAVLAFLETISAKVRLFRAPEFLGTAFLLAVLGMLIHFMLEV